MFQVILGSQSLIRTALIIPFVLQGMTRLRIHVIRYILNSFRISQKRSSQVRQHAQKEKVKDKR